MHPQGDGHPDGPFIFLGTHQDAMDKDALSLNRIYSFVNLSPWAVEAWGNAAHVTERAALCSLRLDSRSDPRAS